jgi:ribonuclease HIII
MNSSPSYKINLTKEPFVKRELDQIGFTFLPTQHAFWRATHGEATVTFYHSGRLLIQGKHVDGIINFLIGIGIIPIPDPNHHYDRWVGTDESGKGDYFGPLTVAAVLVKKDIEDTLIHMGVKDSKRLSNPTIKALADKIKLLCPHATAVFKLPEYNTFYAKIGNLNRILGIGHARVINNILKNHSCDYAICDKFGNEKHIKTAMPPHLKALKLIQRTHAEDDTAVAAASILARDEYVKRLEALSAKFSITLPPGASQKVIETGREFVQRYGAEKLREVAKFHFGTSQYVLNPEMVRDEQLTEFTPQDFLLETCEK